MSFLIIFSSPPSASNAPYTPTPLKTISEVVLGAKTPRQPPLAVDGQEGTLEALPAKSADETDTSKFAKDLEPPVVAEGKSSSHRKAGNGKQRSGSRSRRGEQPSASTASKLTRHRSGRGSESLDREFLLQPVKNIRSKQHLNAMIDFVQVI